LNGPTWTFNKLVGWREKVEQLGLKGVRFHHLRHTGNTLAARSGVSTRDLMSRMGHDSMQAALGYQHATATADARIAAALEAALDPDEDHADDEDQAQGDDQGDEDDDGAAGALDPGRVTAALWPVCGPWADSSLRGRSATGEGEGG